MKKPKNHRIKGDGVSKIYLKKDCTKYAVVDPEDYDRLCDMGYWYVSNGYAITNIKKADGKRTSLYMHHAVLDFKYDPNVDAVVDHINGDKLNNCKYNLQKITQQENVIKQKKRKDNTSGYRGVSWNKASGKWKAYIQVDGKQKHLGYFKELEDAVRAYKEAELKYYGK